MLNDTENEDSATGEGSKLVGNGGQTERYSFTQTLSNVLVDIPIPFAITKKQLSVSLEPDRLAIKIAGQPDINGKFSRDIDSDNSTWTIEERNKKEKFLSLDLSKANKMEWWGNVLEGDPKIDTSKIVPENSRLEDLDADTRQTVEKMMLEQRQKQMGLPSSEEKRKKEALESFMKAHPELDFSKSNIAT